MEPGPNPGLTGQRRVHRRRRGAVLADLLLELGGEPGGSLGLELDYVGAAVPERVNRRVDLGLRGNVGRIRVTSACRSQVGRLHRNVADKKAACALPANANTIAIAASEARSTPAILITPPWYVPCPTPRNVPRSAKRCAGYTRRGEEWGECMAVCR